MLEIQEAGLYPVPELGAPSVLFGQVTLALTLILIIPLTLTLARSALAPLLTGAALQHPASGP